MPAALAFPRRVNVELTNHCNQRCRLCPRQGFTRKLGFMARGLFERIAAECAGRETALWLHFLGEPLLHPEALALVRRAKQLGCRQVGLSTNAVSLGHMADAVLDSGLDRLECSLDALDREGYRALRGRDHFERVVGAVERFLARKRERGLARPVTSLQFMRTPELESLREEVVARWRPHLGPRDFVMTIEPAPFGGAVAEARIEAPPARRPCAWLFEALLVLQDGTVTTCGADWDAREPLGHMADTTLEALWRGAELARRRRAHETGRYADVGICADCDDWALADGNGYANLLEEVDSRAAGA